MIKTWDDCFEDYVRVNSYKDEQTGELVIKMNDVLEGIGHYNHCENCNTESKYNEQIRDLSQTVQTLQNLIIRMLFEKYNQ